MGPDGAGGRQTRSQRARHGHGVVFIATSNTSVEHDVRLYQPEPLRGRDHEFEIETSYCTKVFTLKFGNGTYHPSFARSLPYRYSTLRLSR